MSVFLLIAGYITARLLFSEPSLYAPVSGLIPTIWGTSVFGKLCSLAAMTALIGYLLKTRSLGWKAAGWGKAEPLREICWAAICAVVVWGGSFLLPSDANHSALFKWTPVIEQGASGKLLFFLSACLLTGILEELVYRGGLRAFICRGIEDNGRPNAVFIVVSATLFAAFHWVSTPIAFAVYAAMGMVFAATLVRSGSLRAVMLAHILVNTAHLFGLGNYVRYLFGQG